MEKIYNISEFAEMIGKSVITLQRWDREGTLKACRAPSNRRYYTHTQYLEYMGETIKNDKYNVIYARVSTKNQKDDLKNQIEFVSEFTRRNGIPIAKIYSDFGSGLNYSRKEWNKLIDDCFNGYIKTIYVAHQDRFVRFGFEWICTLLNKYTGVEIVTIDDIRMTPEEEVIKDLIK